MERLHIRDMRERYERDGFYIHATSVLLPALLERAERGIDDVRDGIYDTGRPPVERRWNPGDDPHALCKIEQPQRAHHGLYEAICSPLLGELASTLTDAKLVQVWWVQLLYKPSTPDAGAGSAATNVGWHQDQASWQAAVNAHGGISRECIVTARLTRTYGRSPVCRIFVTCRSFSECDCLLGAERCMMVLVMYQPRK